jgi:hypothetical protein
LPDKLFEVLPYSIKHLSLSQVDVRGFSTLQSLELEKLHLSGVNILESESSIFFKVIASVSSVWCLRVNVLSEPESNLIGEYVIESNPKVLKNFTIDCSDDLFPQILNVASRVESLSIRYSQNVLPSSISSAMFPRLRHLRLFYRDKEYQDLPKEILVLRQNIPSIEKIELSTSRGGFKELYWPDSLNEHVQMKMCSQPADLHEELKKTLEYWTPKVTEIKKRKSAHMGHTLD